MEGQLRRRHFALLSDDDGRRLLGLRRVAAAAAAAKYLLDFERTDGRSQTRTDGRTLVKRARGRGRTGRLSFGKGCWLGVHRVL